MSRAHRIVWNTGMFLSSHHFQQWDRFLQDELRFRRSAGLTHSWGVARCEFDGETLANGRLDLRELEAILPDGTVVRCPAVDPVPTGRLLEDVFGADRDRLEVYLGLPVTRPGVPRCRLPGQPETAASPLGAAAVRVEDENEPGTELEMLVAHQNLRLLLGGENREGYTTLQLAEIERGKDGRFRLRADYAPPSLCLGAAGPAGEVLRGLVEALAAKSTALGAQTRQRSGGIVEFGSSDVGNFWLLHTVNTFLPELAHEEATPQNHPEAAYLALARLAGALCTFGVGRHPRDIPPYRHEHLGETFRALEGQIRELLETVMPSRFTSLELERQDEAMLVGSIRDANLLESGVHWYLAVNGDLPEARVRDEVPVQVLVGSPHNIEFLVRTATPGVRMTHVAVPPRDFPLKAGHTYFSLETHGEAWDTVGESRAVALYLGGPELRALHYELIAMK
jgi:type VI secretion system protein ImpJ